MLLLLTVAYTPPPLPSPLSIASLARARAPDFDFPSPFPFLSPATQANVSDKNDHSFNVIKQQNTVDSLHNSHLGVRGKWPL